MNRPHCDGFLFGAEDVPGIGSTTAHLTPFVRAYLDAVQAFLLHMHDSGEPARRVLEERTSLVDDLVRTLHRIADTRFQDENAAGGVHLAVIAVGGYGRTELALGSDVDLLFLFEGSASPYVEAIAEAITNRLWDARLVVGAATRTLEECERIGREDLSTATSYLDARFLVGDADVYGSFEKAVRNHLREDSAQFVRAKLAEMHARHERSGESPYLLQPNVREGVGGLRDYHTAMWVARAVHWECRRPEQLLLHGFVDAEELEVLLGALDFLWRVRNELHRKGRKNDHLHFDAQEQMAAKLGFRGEDSLLPVEEFMRSYYLHVRAIERVSTRVIDHARRLLRIRHGHRPESPYPVAEGFAIADRRLEVPHPSLLEDRPMRVLSAFAVAQHHDVELSPRSERLIRQNIHRVDEAFRSDPEAADLLLRILGSPTRVYRTLRAMNEVGLLGALIPEFAHLVGLWQQDLYHTYTVDIHSLFLVEQLRRLRRGRYAKELPHATELMREEIAPAELYLACLLHDIGKGLGGGHSQKGADMVPAIARRMGLDDERTDFVRFLVRHHLSMSQMAEQRDVNDARTILRLANLCETRRRLRSLYLLTIADIRSVSPEAWTQWKRELLERLYRNAAEWLEAGEEEEATQQFVERTMQRAAAMQRAAKDLLVAEGLDAQRAEEALDFMPRRYLLRHGAAEMAAHMKASIAFRAGTEPVGVYALRPEEGEAPYWGVVVIAGDRPGLFASVTGVLTACGHDILAADAYTTRDRLAVEVYRMRPIAGGEAEEATELERIGGRLRAVLSGKEALAMRPVRRAEVRPSAMREQPPDVRITNQDSDFYSIIDVATNDRPALLYDITRTMAELGLDVVISRASTRANRAVDSFYVTDGGHKVLDPQRQQAIRERLFEAIRSGGD